MSPPTIQFNTFNEKPYENLKESEYGSSRLAKSTLEKLPKTPDSKLFEDERFRVRTSNIPKPSKRPNNKGPRADRCTTFTKKKSLSLMEIQRFKKGSRFPQSGDHHNQDFTNNLMSQQSSVSMKYFSRSNIQLYKDYYYYVSDPDDSEVDYKLAGRKVFSSIMLYAWRQRREEVRRLNEEIVKIKKASIKSKNQIHVINSLFKVEQKTNDDLNFRLRRCLEDQQKLQDMYNELNKANSVLQAKFSSSERGLEQKIKEIDSLNALLSESKSNLFKSVAQERQLKMSLSNAQRKLLELENEKNELLSMAAELKGNLLEKAEVENNLISTSKEVKRLKTEVAALEETLKDLKHKESQVKEYEQLDATQRKIIEELTDRIYSLEKVLNNTYFCKARNFFSSFGKSSLTYSHLLLYCVLSLTQHPPNLPVSATEKVLEKVLAYCWK